MFTTLCQQLTALLKRIISPGVQEVNRLLEQFQQMRKLLKGI